VRSESSPTLGETGAEQRLQRAQTCQRQSIAYFTCQLLLMLRVSYGVLLILLL
jgi:hypothetical protein